MSSTLARPNTLAVVDLVLQGDENVSPRLRQRALALLEHGSEDTALASDSVSETVFAAILGLDRSTLGRWRRGLAPERGPFPFQVHMDLAGRQRYIRAEAVSFIHRHREAQTAAQASASAAPSHLQSPTTGVPA